jgi:hypothetical protein
MKTLFKHISLLIFSGLIIPFYCLLQASNKLFISNIKSHLPQKSEMPITFRIIKDLAKNLMPELKSENNL